MDAPALTLRSPVSLPAREAAAGAAVAPKNPVGTVSSSSSLASSDAPVPVASTTQPQRVNAPLDSTAVREVDQQRITSGRDNNTNTSGGGRSGSFNARNVDTAQNQPSQSERAEQAAGLTEEEQLQVRELARRDAEVRAHEAAHASAGGAVTGAPTYSFTRGPDGRLYAIGGEVSVDTRPVAGDPEATIEKARTIIAAATAPAEPSSQDLRAAAQAQALLVEAQAELNRQGGAQEEETARVSEAQSSEETSEDRTTEVEARDPVREARDAADKREEISRETEDRLERTRDAQQAFADQLEDLNRNLAKIQQQLIDSGAVSPAQAIGSLLDTSA